ncbi:MAG: aldo/keto reductase [Candidatus Saccharicenans sp.]|uniref:aldo/keto reductase n=1 Tax=Candidatus Saccharicenans sp. TaxID=2819258 RepID=UPI00404A1B2A
MAEKRTINRRKFLGTTAGTVAGMLALGGTVPGATQTRKKEEKAGALITRILGRTGYKVPIVSMGVMNADNPELVRRAYEAGIRHFDTAYGYQRGRNEEMVGRVLVEELKVRDKVVIATKINIRPPQRNLPASEIKEMHRKMIEESLRRLQTDYVDILYSHDVSDPAWLKNPALIDSLLEIKESKKARFIGFSTHQNMNEVVRTAIEMKIYDVILTTLNYSLFDYTEYLETLKAAAAQGIGLVAMKTQCQQGWYRESVPAEMRRFYEGPIIHSALLKWALRHQFIATAVPGFTTFEQLYTDMPVANNLEYTEEEKKFLEDRMVKTQMAAVCRACGQCQPTCPKGVDIPNLLRAHMYAASYGILYQARETLDGLEASRSVKACTDCTVCTARCVRGVNIARRLDELKTLLA